MSARHVTSPAFVFTGIEGQIFEVTVSHTRADDYANETHTVTVVDVEGRQCAVTINYYDEAVASTWVCPAGMERLVQS